MYYKDIQKNRFIHRSSHRLVFLYSFFTLISSVMCCRVVQSSVECKCASDLKREFTSLSQNLSHQNKNFNKLDVYSPVDQLPDNVFLDLKFENIWIRNSNNLTRIHTQSFHNTEYKVKSFICYQNFESRLRNDPPKHDLYQAISSLVNLEKLYLSLSTHEEHEIPDWAFKPSELGLQKKLQFVEWYGYYTITRIGKNIVTELPNVTEIIFKHAIVKNISTEAFILSNDNQNRFLNITFHNTSLNEDIFEQNVFASTGRKVRLDLTGNKIKIMRQNIFEPFFNINEHNYVVMQGNPLNCSNEEAFRWLLVRKHFYENRIFKAFCSNGSKLWDLEVGKTSSTITSSSTATNRRTTGNWITSSTTDSNDNTAETDNTEKVTETTRVSTDDTEVDTEVNYPTDNCDDSGCGDPDEDNPDCIPPECDGSGDGSGEDPGDDGSGEGEEEEEEEGSDVEKIAEEINKELEKLIDATNGENHLNTSEELKQIVDQIQTIRLSLDSITSLDYEKAFNLTNNILKVLSNLLNQNNAWLKTMAEERTVVAAQVLNQIEMTSFFLTCNQNNDNKTIEKLINDNVVVNLYKNYVHDISFEANNSSIIIPKEVLIKEGVNDCGNSSFAALIKRLDNYLGRGLHDGQGVNTEMVSFSILNTSDFIQFEDGINIKISMIHRNQLEFGDQMLCVYWDFSTMSWSSEGCHILKEESNRQFTVCLCNHLTNFAAIMDISGRETDDHSKSILTIVFCGLSIVCLLLTVCLLLLPHQTCANTITDRLVKTRTLITINLALMLIVADLLIIFGMDRISNIPLCQSISVILLYSLLSSFSWMALEGYHLYRMTVHIFVSDSRKGLLFCVGYGLPIVVIVIGLLIIKLQHGKLFDILIGDYFCWISSDDYPNNIWLIIGPASFAILFNIAMMIVLIRRVVESGKNNNSNRSGIILKQIFGITSLLFNLGITWISFLLYIGQIGHYFSYVFIVLNGSQGIFIFIYHLVIVLSQRKKALMTIKMTLSNKWSTRTIQTIG